MDVLTQLRIEIVASIQRLFDYDINSDQIILSPTKKEFDGDFTLVVFPFVKALKKSPQEIAESIGSDVASKSSLVEYFNVIKGFLNFGLSVPAWNQIFDAVCGDAFHKFESKGEKYLVEYSSPNTNKPLHLGHLRNILLGWSVAQLAKACGYEVIKTQIINDRGIAICKSMLAWVKIGNAKTPESESIKGDHFVGHYYVEFEHMFKSEYAEWQGSEPGQKTYKELRENDESQEVFFKRFKNLYFNEFSTLGKEAKEMLIRWEEGDTKTVALWKRMNGWVYEGFDITFKAMGVDFDKNYYESDTYLLGKRVIEENLKTGLFYQKEDGSIWADLEHEGMDQKILLRSDGTSVYITQDIGTAMIRYKNHGAPNMVYVVADEQDYHFKALFAILRMLKEPYADGLHHLNYGMVDLPSGKMKSREGTVVDADDLMAEVIEEARKSAEERGGIEGLTEAEKSEVYRKIGLAALKYFIIKINPRKRMTFDPKESVDMQGTTGPYIQNAFVRIRSILRKAEIKEKINARIPDDGMHEIEKEIIQLILSYKDVIEESLNKLDPSLVANYAYSLAKLFHRFYHDCRILKAETEDKKRFRLSLCHVTATTLENSMMLLGIEMPEYM